jgi:DNA topoisomerase-1
MRTQTVAALTTDSAADPQARAAVRAEGLRYTTDHDPGIRRVRRGGGFAYVGPDGRAIADRDVLARIRSLVIPPAYKDVWICPHENGHLQATGRDARGRKQYRYHPRWRTQRDATKFERMLEFGRVLPRIRRRVARDLRQPGLPREKVIATIVRLLEGTLVRVGNEEYVRHNGSFGLTTLRNRHAEVKGGIVQLEFRGKRGVMHRVALEDRAVARIVSHCLDIPGQELFQYIDEGGERRRIDSADVNDYLREASGGPFTAKDFRTWFATVHAVELLCSRTSTTEREARRLIVETVATVSQRLGNTPAICRKCYIHPAVFTAFSEGTLSGTKGMSPPRLLRELLSPRRPLRSHVHKRRSNPTSGTKVATLRRLQPPTAARLPNG